MEKQRFKGFNIYLHDRGQFWPGLEMGRIGMSTALYLKKNMEWSGSFIMNQKTLINKESIKCEDDPDYSFQQCVFSWVSQTAGCHLDWLYQPPLNTSTRICSSNQDILRYSVSENSLCHATKDATNKK